MTEQNHINDSDYPAVSFLMNAVSIAVPTLRSAYLFKLQCPSLTHVPRSRPARLPQAEVASFCFLIHLAQYIAHILLN